MAILYPPSPLFVESPPALVSHQADPWAGVTMPSSAPTREQRSGVGGALQDIAAHIRQQASGFTDESNRAVEVRRAGRLEALSRLLRSREGISGEQWRKGVEEVQRNVGISEHGAVQIGGTPMPITGVYDQRVDHVVRSLGHGSGWGFTMAAAQAATTRGEGSGSFISTVNLKEPEGVERAIDRLGIDHPLVVNAIAKATNTEPQFVRKTILLAEELGTSPLHLLTVMNFETAGAFRTGAYPAVKTVGLIQFTPAGVAHQESVEIGEESSSEYLDRISRMSRSRQLDEVEEYFVDRAGGAGHYRELLRLYLTVLSPDTLGQLDEKGLTSVLYDKENSPRAYRANRGLDRNRDGAISAGETLTLILQSRDGLLTRVGGQLDLMG